MRRFFSFIAGALTGGLVGAVLAMLFTPIPGQVLRNKIIEKSIDISNEVKEAQKNRRIELENELAKRRRPTPK